MRISYELTADDVVAAHLLHFAHSPATHWLRVLMRVIGPAMTLALVLVAFFQDIRDPVPIRRVWIAMPLALLLGGSLYLLLPWGVPRNIAKRIRRKLEQENLEGKLLGTCTMDLSGSRLTATTRLGESTWDLRAIKDIQEFDDYALVYLTATQMHVIPIHNVLPENEYRAFVAALYEAWANHGSNDPMEDRFQGPPDHRVTG